MGGIRTYRWLGLLAFVALAASAAIARAQGVQAEYQLRGEPHAGVPFHLDAVIEGLEESPAPAQPKLQIAGATVTPVAVQPNVSRSIQIINGRRIDSTRVTWVMRWRVLAPKPGRLVIPPLTIQQSGKSAAVAGAELQVDVIPTADDMKLELVLPDRPVFVGETVPVKIVWMFQRGPQGDPEFSIPFTSLDTFTITTPPAPQGKALEIDIGAKRVQVPYTVDKTTVGGEEYQRVTIELLAAPRTIPPGGKLEVPPTSIAVPLAVGRPNFFGEAPKRMFRATDVARTLEVKPLPESGRPPSFAGAVGEQYSIEVRTSRSVVQLGEPVELDVTVKSDQRLDALALGKLDVEGRLPKDKFTVAAEPATGELSDDGKTKTFKVVAQVTGPATEVPAIAFSYFDPRKGTYQTIHSEPIALSVKGGTMVGANDVVARPTKRSAAPALTDDTTLVNADLALSSSGAVDDQPLGGAVLWLLIGLLYAVPLALLGFRTYQLRTAGQREEAAEVRAARRRVEEILDRASRDPAREVAGPLAGALRDLARVLGRSPDDHGLLAKLETESFAPDASGRPLSNDLRAEAAGLMRRWQQAERKKPARAAAVTILVATLLAPQIADADPLGDGRALYQQAMEQAGDATARKNAFARAAIALGEAARTHPGRPELLADWGNAALGAGDVATATLAYRRALAIDGSNARARHNLTWLRSRQADMFRPTTTASATDNLLFFHRWPRTQRLLVGAAAFAIAISMFVPWGGRRRKTLLGLAVIPLAVWLAMIVSVVFEDRHTDDAVVMDGVVMRAADSAGAPAALPTPLPRGAEVTVLERRDAWTRIRIANGTTGWVPAGSVEPL
jgi:tetratricopeptide (TPR) repeat protein